MRLSFARNEYPHRLGGSAAFRRAMPTLVCLVVGMFSVPAAANASGLTSASQCTVQALSQPFAAFGDHNSYYLLDGGDFTNPSGGDWQLSGGAKVISAGRPDKSSGGVLYLPAGSQARSPLTCVNLAYPTARMWVKNLNGGNGVDTAVFYPDSMTAPASTGQIHSQQVGAWSLTNPVNVQPNRGSASGWSLMQFVFTPKGQGQNYELYGVWVDPCARR